MKDCNYLEIPWSYFDMVGVLVRNQGGHWILTIWSTPTNIEVSEWYQLKIDFVGSSKH